jgi:hypothetical protein
VRSNPNVALQQNGYRRHGYANFGGAWYLVEIFNDITFLTLHKKETKRFLFSSLSNDIVQACKIARSLLRKKTKRRKKYKVAMLHCIRWYFRYTIMSSLMLTVYVATLIKYQLIDLCNTTSYGCTRCHVSL